MTPRPDPSVADDLVVLLDERRRPVGTAPREGVHSTETPLHLAFSCWLQRPDGSVLLTRRALGKRSWPGVWTNAFCGHPRPGESLPAAVERYGRFELGVQVEQVRELLPDFAYRAVDASGVVENEVCPVFLAITRDEVAPRPDEVVEHRWVTVDELRAALAAAPWALSPWLCEQASEVDAGQAWSVLTDHLSGVRYEGVA